MKMTPISDKSIPESALEPLCPVFGQCGGCCYQNLDYGQEIEIKGGFLKTLLADHLDLNLDCIQPAVASPDQYGYRHRLDLTIKRRKGELVMGFQSEGSRDLIPISECAIAKTAVSHFLPQLEKEAREKMPQKYRTATLVVKTGDDERVVWGGIGRGSLKLKEEDYLWTEIHGKKIYYSLDTFFQANLSILPKLMDTLRELANFDKETIFFDLYAGVGLFGIYFADQVKRVLMVEEVPASIKAMEYNIKHHQLKNAEVCSSRVEDSLLKLLENTHEQRNIAMIDPPRRGLSEEVLNVLTKARTLESLFYLSCHPESLVRDLKGFCDAGWNVKSVIPFDFFPKTKHLETLVVIKP